MTKRSFLAKITELNYMLVAIASLFASANVYATTFQLPSENQSVIGHLQYTTSKSNEDVTALARRYDVGYNELEGANPHIDFKKKLSSGMKINVPTTHLLPDYPRQGMVVNLPEMRMYYYPQGSHSVVTYPVGIGTPGKMIPITSATVVRKLQNPSWYPPPDIREYNILRGIVLPKVMPPGPDNPLGPYAIYLTVRTYLIHSTIFPDSVGKRGSFGCLRMYENDIADMFPTVDKGIVIEIINSPIKINWQNANLYLEAHNALEEYDKNFDNTLPGIVHAVTEKTQGKPVLVDWQLVSFLSRDRDGLPHEIAVPVK